MGAWGWPQQGCCLVSSKITKASESPPTAERFASPLLGVSLSGQQPPAAPQSHPHTMPLPTAPAGRVCMAACTHALVSRQAGLRRSEGLGSRMSPDSQGKDSRNLGLLAAAPALAAPRPAGPPMHSAAADLFPETLAGLLCWA